MRITYKEEKKIKNKWNDLPIEIDAKLIASASDNEQ